MDHLKRLQPYLNKYRKAIVPGVVCMVLSGLLGGSFLFLGKEVLEPMLDPTTPDRLARLNLFTMIVLGVSFVKGLVDFGEIYIIQRTGQRILTDLRDDLFEHFQSLSTSYFDQGRTGEVLSRMTNDLSAMHNALARAVAASISSPIELVISLGAMVYFNWRLSIFVLVVLPPVALLIQRARRKTGNASTQLQEQLALLTNYLQEKIGAMRLIQTFGTQAHEIQLFRKVNHETYKHTMTPIRIRAALEPTIEFTGMVGVTISLWFGAREVVSGHMEAAALIAFLFAVQRAAVRLRQVASLQLMMQEANASAGRLFPILDTKPEIRDAPSAIDLRQRPVQGHLVFDNVRFAYAGGPEVLHSISFEIKPGEVVALAGLSGSGKSSIASLVPRLYDPQSGRVLIDGLDLRDVQMASLRWNIGVVPQDTTLFDGTIRDNIAYGRPDATLDEIVEAARRAHADEFVRLLPDGYEALIGERGCQLSGGQRQRLAIARALLRDPRVLILDEATSSLDAQSESLVQDALGTLMHGRTTLIIAHRFATIQKANRILVLDQGSIVESGSHEALLQQKRALYYRLHQMQSFAAQSAAQNPDQETEDAPATHAAPNGAARLGAM